MNAWRITGDGSSDEVGMLGKHSQALLLLERDLASALSGATEVDEILRRSLQAGLEATGLDCGGVYLLDPDSGELRLECHTGLSSEFVREVAVYGPGTDESGIVGNLSEIVHFDGISSPPPGFAAVEREGLKAVIVVPVIHDGCPVGSMNLGSRTQRRVRADAEHALQTIAAQMCIALARARAEATHRHVEAELRAVYDSSPVMMCVLDSALRVQYLNRTMAEFIGQSEEELRHRRACGMIGCLHALDDPRGCGYGDQCESCSLRLAMLDTLRTGTCHRGIERSMTLLRNARQHEVVLLGATAMVRSRFGTSLLLCLEEITDRKRAEQALEEQADFTRRVFDSTDSHLAVVDLAGTILSCNAAWRRFARDNGSDDESSWGQGANYFARYSSAWGDASHAAEAYEGLRQVQRGERSCFELEYPCHRPTGEQRWFAMRVLPLQGRAGTVLVSHTDITQRRQSEASLRESRARLAESHQLLTAVLGYTHMMAAFLDPQFNFIWVNRAYADSCRREPAFFPGKNHFQLYPHEENQIIFQRVVETGQPFFVAARPFEYPDQPDRGTSYWDWSLIPVTDEGGKTTGLVLTLADVTQRKESEARLRSLESQLNHASRLASLGELAAGIAHEVNQPLCAVVNFARACGNLAAQDVPDLTRIREWADAIASTAADAGDIIRRVIRFARRAQPDREPVRVRELVDNAILLIHHEAEQRRVVIRANAIAEDLTVFVQSVSIQQVLVNLLCNGIESLEAVPPDNRVVCVDAAPRGDWVEISVSDNGAGLTDDCRAKIFEPFFTTKPQGLGLGLPLSRTIVEENAGRIWTTDSKAGGLAVHFTLPTRKE